MRLLSLLGVLLALVASILASESHEKKQSDANAALGYPAPDRDSHQPWSPDTPIVLIVGRGTAIDAAIGRRFAKEGYAIAFCVVPGGKLLS